MLQHQLFSSAHLKRLLNPASSKAAIGRLIGASASLATVELESAADAPIVVIANDPRHADQLEAEIRWFGGPKFLVQHFVEWETLPYDSFSPHQDIVSKRLKTLASLHGLSSGIVIISAPSLLQRLPPVDYVAAHTLKLDAGQTLQRQAFIDSLSACGYSRVPQVDAHGEFAVRGSLLDIFPMSSDQPIRIDFLMTNWKACDISIVTLSCRATKFHRSKSFRHEKYRWMTTTSVTSDNSTANASKGNRQNHGFIEIYRKGSRMAALNTTYHYFSKKRQRSQTICLKTRLFSRPTICDPHSIRPGTKSASDMSCVASTQSVRFSVLPKVF